MDAMDEYDVIVVGSGAAGMTAALTAAHHGLRTVLIEKAAHFGGSTARSGGGVWIPNNDVLLAEGVPDTPDSASTYLKYITGDVVDEDLRAAFLDNGPAMLRFVLASTPLRMRWVTDYSDYYPEAPGGLPTGRSLEPRPLDAAVLGDELAKLAPPYLRAPTGLTVTQADFRWLNLVARHPRGMLRSARVAARRIVSLVLRRQLLVMGQALTGGLRAGMAAKDIPLLLGTQLTNLVVEDGRVTGVEVLHDGQPATMRATRGVLLASGGFEHNERMRKEYQQAPIGTEWTVGAAENTGDGIEAGMRLGGAVALMDDAWWGPSIMMPRGPYFCLAERSLPGCIMVNQRGERFVNEAAPYVDAVHAMYETNSVPAWLIADQTYRNRYIFAGLGPRQPFPGRWYKFGTVRRAQTLEALAEEIEIPPEKLRDTVTTFNGFAESGVDGEFHRGDSAYDRYYGDPRNRPNPNLAPLRRAPFYAVRIVPGDLGTKGGLRTDTAGRVLREDGSVIDGLYAAGNASAPVMGRTYAGPGATLGPAMVFGYLAALDMAGAKND
jgi:3-oxosteroid 1-dehydrogenase